jgi:hydrogenase maturation protease
MPEIHLFVVSIESLQQQGIELTSEISGVLPKLLNEIDELVEKIGLRAA